MIEPNREAPTSWGPVHIRAHQPISRAVPSVAPLDAPHKTPAAAIDGRARGLRGDATDDEMKVQHHRRRGDSSESERKLTLGFFSCFARVSWRVPGCAASVYGIIYHRRYPPSPRPSQPARATEHAASTVRFPYSVTVRQAPAAARLPRSCVVLAALLRVLPARSRGVDRCGAIPQQPHILMSCCD